MLVAQVWLLSAPPTNIHPVRATPLLLFLILVHAVLLILYDHHPSASRSPYAALIPSVFILLELNIKTRPTPTTTARPRVARNLEL